MFILDSLKLVLPDVLHYSKLKLFHTILLCFPVSYMYISICTIIAKFFPISAIKVLLTGGYDLRKDHVFRDHLHLDTVISSYLHQETETVKPLQRLCRETIRKSLGHRRVEHKVRKLPLPHRMIDYVNLADCLELTKQKCPNRKNHPIFQRLGDGEEQSASETEV